MLTKDERIRYRPLERTALLDSGVRAFVLTVKALTGAEMGSAFVTALPAMERLLARREPPFIARVSPTGGVALMDRS